MGELVTNKLSYLFIDLDEETRKYFNSILKEF
ncbi:hypothetical protein [Thomasclavelia cocleata]